MLMFLVGCLGVDHANANLADETAVDDEEEEDDVEEVRVPEHGVT